MTRSRIACSTFPFQGLPLDQAFVRMRDLGFALADISIHWDPGWGHITPLQAQREPLEVLEMLETARRTGGVAAAAFNLATNILEVGERGQVEAVLKLARRAGVPLVNVLASNRDEVLEIRRLRDFAAMAADHGVVLALETYDQSAAIKPAVATGWTESVPGLGITLDTGHLLSCGIAQADWAPLFPLVKHVHVKDAGTQLDRYQVPLGEGALDLPAFTAALERSGYRGAYAVEYIGPRPEDARRFDPEPEVRKLREALARALEAA